MESTDYAHFAPAATQRGRHGGWRPSKPQRREQPRRPRRVQRAGNGRLVGRVVARTDPHLRARGAARDDVRHQELPEWSWRVQRCVAAVVPGPLPSHGRL